MSGGWIFSVCFEAVHVEVAADDDCVIAARRTTRWRTGRWLGCRVGWHEAIDAALHLSELLEAALHMPLLLPRLRVRSEHVKPAALLHYAGVDNALVCHCVIADGVGKGLEGLHA